MQNFDQVYPNLARLKRLILVDRQDEAEQAACTVVKNIFEDAPTLGLDLDGTIDEAPGFFKLLTMIWPGAVVIITCRGDGAQEAAEERAKELGVYFDKLVVVNGLRDKAVVIREHEIGVYIDDQDECLMDIPLDVTVLKIRNPGNFEDGRWLYSDATGELV